MNDIWAVIVTILVFVMLFGNKKVCLYAILKKQMQVFKNARTENISIWDLLCFIIFPICVAAVISYEMNIIIDEVLSSILATVFSLVFTVLFGFAAIIVGKLDSQNKTERKVVEETFVSIMSATILSMASVICSIVAVKISTEWCINLISTIAYSTSITTVMLLLLVSKRTFAIYNSVSQS